MTFNTLTDPFAYAWRPGACLLAKGPDARTFLQGQFSNDLKNLSSVDAVYGLWLNQKGRVLADSFVMHGDNSDELRIFSYFSKADSVREHLERHIVADEVEISDETDRMFGTTLTGPGAKERADASGSRPILAARRGIPGAVEWISRTPAEAGDVRWLGDNEMALARILAGIPAIPADIGPGELPNEGGLESAAISYTKGCFLGQEVMARLKSMGRVRRRLCRVEGDGSAPVCPAKIFQGARAVGELRSVAASGSGFAGLALLTLLNLRGGDGVALAADGPPFVRMLDTL